MVIRNATQTNVTGDKNWATIRRGSDQVIIEATTTPNTEACWKQIRWSGNATSAVAGQPNVRSLSRASSGKYHVEAELGGVKDHLDIWVLWGTVTILTDGTTPANSAQFGPQRDGTEKLGAIGYKSFLSNYDEATKTFTEFDAAAGKVAIVATLTPSGVHTVVPSGWALKRELWCHDWSDGKKLKPGNKRGDRWNTAWVDDTSLPSNLRLTPDAGDKIYDLDAPNIDAGMGGKTYETYNNFRQWVEWNGEVCSDKAPWYWIARWRSTSKPNVTLKEVGTVNKPLPERSYFHP
jgi:hypothetical protein